MDAIEDIMRELQRFLDEEYGRGRFWARPRPGYGDIIFIRETGTGHLYKIVITNEPDEAMKKEIRGKLAGPPDES